MLKKITMVLATSVAAMFATTEAGLAQTKLKWAHVYETSEPFHTASVWAAQEIGKRTNGRYQIDVYPASQLGKEADINQGLSLGSVDIIISGSSFARARAFRRSASTYYPTRSATPTICSPTPRATSSRSSPRVIEDKSGHHIIAVTYYGVRQTSSNKPIKTCADLKGLKMRVPDVPAYLAMPRACGANTAPIAFAEVYLALQNGTVEAQENPLTTIEAKKFYEVQKHIVLTGHIVDHLATVVAGALWKKLSDEDKKIFTDVAQEAAAKATAEIKQNEAKLVAFFKEKGLTVTEVDKNEFRDIVLKNVHVRDRLAIARPTGNGSRRSSNGDHRSSSRARSGPPGARGPASTAFECRQEIDDPHCRAAPTQCTGRSPGDVIDDPTPSRRRRRRRSISASTLSRTGWRW